MFFIIKVLGVLFMPSISRGHPLASIVYREQFPPFSLSAGVILTERLILTTTNPICAYDFEKMCVLPLVTLSMLSYSHYIQQCIEVEDLIFPGELKKPIELVALKTSRNIMFEYGTNVAMLPMYYVPNKPGEGLFPECYELVLMRDTRPGTYGLTRNYFITKNNLRVIEPAEDSEYIEVGHSGIDYVYCTSYNGMPIMCNYEVTFLLLFQTDPCKKSVGFFELCLSACSKSPSVTYVNLLSKSAQEFIRSFMPGAEDLEKYKQKMLNKGKPNQ